MDLYTKRFCLCSVVAASFMLGSLICHKSSNTNLDLEKDVETSTSFSTSVSETSMESKPVDIPIIETTMIKKSESLSVPNIDTSFKAYMDYRTITCTSSMQYEMQLVAYTDEFGIRKIGDYYCVALGTFYSPTCGNCFHITTDTGNEFDVIVSDIKNDIHTDATNRYVPMDDNSGNVLEFVVDTKQLDEYVKKLGNISGYKNFSGNIVSIEPIRKENTYA